MKALTGLLDLYTAPGTIPFQDALRVVRYRQIMEALPSMTAILVALLLCFVIVDPDIFSASGLPLVALALMLALLPTWRLRQAYLKRSVKAEVTKDELRTLRRYFALIAFVLVLIPSLIFRLANDGQILLQLILFFTTSIYCCFLLRADAIVALLISVPLIYAPWIVSVFFPNIPVLLVFSLLVLSTALIAWMLYTHLNVMKAQVNTELAEWAARIAPEAGKASTEGAANSGPARVRKPRIEKTQTRDRRALIYIDVIGGVDHMVGLSVREKTVLRNTLSNEIKAICETCQAQADLRTDSGAIVFFKDLDEVNPVHDVERILDLAKQLGDVQDAVHAKLKAGRFRFAPDISIAIGFGSLTFTRIGRGKAREESYAVQSDASHIEALAMHARQAGLIMDQDTFAAVNDWVVGEKLMAVLGDDVEDQQTIYLVEDDRSPVDNSGSAGFNSVRAAR
ncbi:MAG: hypothetical protein AB8B71_12950 [Paracoccaceae bacterium]